MKQKTAITTLAQWDKQGKYIYKLKDFAKLFPLDTPKALQEGLNRLVKHGLLERVCKGVYLFTLSANQNSNTIEEIAKALRRGEYNYVSLESALSEYGAISQIPIDRLTVMTTGRKGVYETPYGIIEFTHTKRSILDILENIVDVDRPLRLAKVNTAWRDLKRVGRNTHLVNMEAIND